MSSAARPTPPLFDEAFVTGQIIGLGSFGEVRECRPTAVGHSYLVQANLINPATSVPQLVVKSPRRGAPKDNREREADERERQALQSWTHKNIVQFFGEFPDSTGSPHLVLERIGGLADGPHIGLLTGEDQRASSTGELWRYIVTRDRITDGEFRLMSFQILSATAYLHENGVAHRDLKTENMLCGLPMITTSLGIAPTVKLSDFGTARVLSVEDQFGVTHHREGTVISIVNGQPRWLGTTQFIAPELLRAGIDRVRQAREDGAINLDNSVRYLGAYDKNCDIYSLGITFVFMLTKTLPYGTSNDAALLFRFMESGSTAAVLCNDVMIQYNVNEETRKLVLSMLHIDPLQRSSAKDLLSSRYFDMIRAEM